MLRRGPDREFRSGQRDRDDPAFLCAVAEVGASGACEKGVDVPARQHDVVLYSGRRRTKSLLFTKSCYSIGYNDQVIKI